MENTKNNRVYIVYDGECPLCKNYVRHLRIKETVQCLELVNAREEHSILREIRDRQLDIDEGMVLVMEGTYYHGADAIHMISLLSSPSGLFNRFNYLIFKHKRLSYLIYPILRFGRNLLLKMLNIKKIKGSF